MKLQYPTTTVALVAAALPALVNSYNVGGYMFGRPLVVTGRCGPSSSCNGQPRSDWVDRAFEELESDMNRGGFPGGPTRRRSRRRGSGRLDFDSDKEDKAVQAERAEAFRQQQKQQQEMFKKAMNLANDVVSTLASDASTKDSDSVKQQKEWLNTAFGIVNDFTSGRSSPRYEVKNGDDKYQISLDVPGVKLSDIDITVVDDEARDGNAKTLVIKGKRESSLGGEKEPVEFKKEFSFDASVIDVDTISAQLNNGVLLVSASKIPKKEPEKKKIQVVQVADDNTVSEDTSSDVDVLDASSKTVEMKAEDDEGTSDENDDEKEKEEDEKEKP